MGAQTLSKKHALVDRLRHVRSSALPASAKTCEGGHNSEKPPIYPPSQAELDTSQRGRSGDRARKPSAKARPVHREGALDMQELDTRLEQYARISKHPHWVSARDEAKAYSTEDESDCETLQQQVVASTKSANRVAAHGTGSGMAPSDQQTEEQPGPSSDFQTFLREAEEDDRRRGPEGKGHGAPGRGREQQPLNLFYSNNWVARSEPPEKLSEIQESDDEDGSGSSGGGGGGEGTTSGAGGTAADVAAVKDVAAPRMPPLPRAHTDPCGAHQGSRHVQFTSGTCEAGERAGGRRGSGASCTHRMKSPPRPVRRQRSMMKVIADYIRLPRD